MPCFLWQITKEGGFVMDYSLYQLSWIFVLCSFIGWILSTSAAAVREKKFVDVGFLYGPYCPAYGFGAVLFVLFLSELHNSLFFLFLGGVVLSFLCSQALCWREFFTENGGIIPGKDSSLEAMSICLTPSCGGSWLWYLFPF